MHSSITIITFAIFLVLFLWIGALAAKVSNQTETDYLLGNRSFGKFFVGLSAGATVNSGWIMVGAVGTAYKIGLSALLMVIPLFLGELTFWILFPDKVNRMSLEQDSQTVPEFLGATVKTPRGQRAIAMTVGLISVVFIGALTAAQFSAAAKTLDIFFGVNSNLGIIIAAGCILSYCVTGGLRASIWTDVVQAFVVMAVCFGILPAAIIAGGGIPEILSQLKAIDPQLANLTAGFTNLGLLAYGLGWFAFGFASSLSKPQVLVRLLAGRSPQEAKQAGWVYLAYEYSTWTAMVLFGMVCRAVIPNLNDPEQALPIYAAQNFNPWLVGIILAGVFSAIASTADSILLVCSSALARDISPSFYRKMSRRYGVRYEQAMTLLFGILAIPATMFISTPVFSLVLFSGGALGGSLGPAMLIAVLKRRTHSFALNAMMLTGLATTIIWRILGYHQILNEVFLGFVVALSVHEILMQTVFRIRLSA